jgi:hypothetical protein
MWGYSFALSDVRVTLQNSAEFDCLQKIHPVGQFVAAGFAGSVRIGFAMIDELSELLKTGDSTQAWIPEAVSQWWPEDARRVFALFPKQERALQSHLLMIATHPIEMNGPSARATAYIFKSPDFLPEEIKVHKIDAIGSGNGIVECRSAIDQICSSDDSLFSLMKGEQGTPGGMGMRLGMDLSEILKRVRPSGVSAHLHYCWVYRGRIVIRANDHSVKSQWTTSEAGSGTSQSTVGGAFAKPVGDGWEKFQMPGIAVSWGQLESLLNAKGASATGSIA